jgi:ABC-type phosphate/phosphonate transport system ATPase subunit
MTGTNKLAKITIQTAMVFQSFELINQIDFE